MRLILVSFIFTILFFTAGCQSESEPSEQSAQTPGQPAPAPGTLTTWETIHGIGPVKNELALKPTDASLAEQGEKIFDMKCAACHKLDERYVGPAIRDVLSRRNPEFIMNMILNPDEMVKRHPEVQKMLAEYLTPMTYQNVSEQEALAILEYFRVLARQTKKQGK